MVLSEIEITDNMFNLLINKEKMFGGANENRTHIHGFAI